MLLTGLCDLYQNNRNNPKMMYINPTSQLFHIFNATSNKGVSIIAAVDVAGFGLWNWLLNYRLWNWLLNYRLWNWLLNYRLWN